MRRICLTVEYDGTAYCGWQIQPNGPTVQAVLEEAIRHLTGGHARVQGAGRTDAGVHARGQVAVFDTESTIPAENFASALNSRLPKDVVVHRSEEVEASFDPRRHAKRKLYRYTLHASAVRPVIGRWYCWHIKMPLDVARMQEAARMFVGTHDFTTFSNQQCNVEGANNVRTIDRCEVCVDGPRVTVDVEGRSFLYNMVRNMVGTLVDVGTGRFAPCDIGRLLAVCDRQQAGQGAPACGLCMEWIRYE